MLNYDYTFIYFTGHGFYNKDSYQHYACLKDCYIPENSLVTNSKRQTLILDSCSGFLSNQLIESEGLGDNVGRMIKNTRHLFENSISIIPEGRNILYAASPGQYALDHPHLGGAFTKSILDIAEYWDKYNDDSRVLSLFDVCENSKRLLKPNYGSIQTPYIRPERTTKYFPFAVKFLNQDV